MERPNALACAALGVAIGLLAPAACTTAQSDEAGTVSIDPVVGEPAPVLAAPPVLTDAERARLERALEGTHGPTPFPFPVESGGSEVTPTSPPSRPAPPPSASAAPGTAAPGGGRGHEVTVRAPGSASPSRAAEVVRAGGVILDTRAWYAAVSTDGGATFHYIDPSTGPFAPVNDGFCCDRVPVYDPSRGAIFYLQQYRFDGTTGTQRINIDVDADGDFECYYDVTPQTFGRPASEWLDRPELILAADDLVHTAGTFAVANPARPTSSVVARYPLDAMARCRPLEIDFSVATPGERRD